MEKFKIPENNRTHITDICNGVGKSKTLHNYQFRWLDDDSVVPNLSDNIYEVYDLNNKLLCSFTVQSDLCKFLNVNKGIIYGLLKQNKPINGYVVKEIIFKPKRKFKNKLVKPLSLQYKQIITQYLLNYPDFLIIDIAKLILKENNLEILLHSLRKLVSKYKKELNDNNK